MVKEGKVKNKLKFRVYRGEDILTNGEILSLKRNKDCLLYTSDAADE